MSAITGLHHVTAITSDPQQNIDFYTGVLGLRLVKLTVNFDDPESYHLYYGDELGRPGTIMTFFAWPGVPRARIGPPQVTATAFAIPSGASEYWEQTLASAGTAVDAADRFGEKVLGFDDPDGLRIELIELKNPAGEPWKSQVPADKAIRGFHSVTLSVTDAERTAPVLQDIMGFEMDASDENRTRYHAPDSNGFANRVDIVADPATRAGGLGAGVVHHVAFRVPDDESQTEWRKHLIAGRLNVTPVADRTYFHSIYFREPGGILFEIATANPGFTFDQPAEALGAELMLPRWIEPRRDDLEKILPRLHLPQSSNPG
jgi:glyoxalase family protein